MSLSCQLDELRLGPDGVQVFRQVLSDEAIERLAKAIGKVIAGEPVKPYGIRSIAERSGEVGELVRNRSIVRMVDAALSERWRLVRSIFFDKVPGANWHVGWHQDLSIAVRVRPAFEISGFSGWTEKEGVPHVQAPAELLERMVTLRIHLDDTGAENGPLRVVPGSHRERFGSEQIRERIESGSKLECVVEAGDVVAMRPMLLHASHKAESPGHRRVIHLEFGPVNGLPEGLAWA